MVSVTVKVSECICDKLLESENESVPDLAALGVRNDSESETDSDDDLLPVTSDVGVSDTSSVGDFPDTDADKLGESSVLERSSDWESVADSVSVFEPDADGEIVADALVDGDSELDFEFEADCSAVSVSDAVTGIENDALCDKVSELENVTLIVDVTSSVLDEVQLSEAVRDELSDKEGVSDSEADCVVVSDVLADCVDVFV